MAVFTRIKTWVSNEVLTASDLNGEFNNLLNNTIPGSIEDYSVDVSQMQSTADPGGVGTESLATTLAGELQRLRFVLKRFAGTAQWYIDAGRSFATGMLGVQTADVADGAITNVKLGARGQQISALTTAGFASSATGETLITNLNATITTTGRPVKLLLIGNTVAGSGTITYEATGSTTIIGGVIYAYRGLTNITQYTFFQVMNTASASYKHAFPTSSCEFIDVVAAGTYTYSFTVAASPNTNIKIEYTRLIAYEI